MSKKVSGKIEKKDLCPEDKKIIDEAQEALALLAYIKSLDGLSKQNFIAVSGMEDQQIDNLIRLAKETGDESKIAFVENAKKLKDFRNRKVL